MELCKLQPVRPCVDARGAGVVQKRRKPRHVAASCDSRPEWDRNFCDTADKRRAMMRETKVETTHEIDIPVPDWVCTHVKSYKLNHAGEAEPCEDLLMCKKPLQLAPWTGVTHPHKVKVTHTKVTTPCSTREWTETAPSGYWLARVKNAAQCPKEYFMDSPPPCAPSPPPPGATLYRSTTHHAPGMDELGRYMRPLTMRRGAAGGYSIDW